MSLRFTGTTTSASPNPDGVPISRRLRRAGVTLLAVMLTAWLALASAPPAMADATFSETVGGDANTWTNPANAGGDQGPTISAFTAVEVACKLTGFQVADGDTWWYRIVSAPWSYAYYVSADAFYNNGATSGSLHGTPFVDPAVPDCGSGGGSNETAGGAADTWTDYSNAGGTAGPQIGSGQTVQISCKLPGFQVSDGNTWWYRVASAPWNNGFYVSADAFYNNGAASGSLRGTPWVDPAVPDCNGSSGGSSSSPKVTLTQGPAAPAGYRYAITLSGFAAGTSVNLNCYDSASPDGFYPFSLQVDGNGSASTQNYCYSGDGPDHWVVAAGRFESNHLSWDTPSAGSSSPGTSQPGSGGTPAPASPPCLYNMKWKKIHLFFTYTGPRRYYGNAWQAAKNWTDLHTGITIKPWTSKTQSADIVFDDVDLGKVSYAGEAQIPSSWWGPLKSVPTNPHSAGYVHIKINRTGMNTLDDFHKTLALTHEIGHALGLAHSDFCGVRDDSIMLSGDLGNPPVMARTFNKPTAYDKMELKLLYGL